MFFPLDKKNGLIIVCQESKNRKADISLFYKGTKKVGDMQILGDVVQGEYDKLFFVENKSFKYYTEVWYKGKSLGYIGVENTDTHEDMRYRAQDQLGVPFKKIHVKKKKSHHSDRIDGYVIEVEKDDNVSNVHNH